MTSTSAEIRELDPSQHVGRRRRRRSGIGLIASLTVNLFLLAAIGGHVLHQRSVDRFGSTPLLERLTGLAQLLPPGDAATFRTVMRRDAPRYVDAAVALAAAREDVERTVAARPFDPAAVRGATVVWRADWMQFTGNVSGALVDALDRMSPDGRAILVQAERHGKGADPALGNGR